MIIFVLLLLFFPAAGANNTLDDEIRQAIKTHQNELNPALNTWKVHVTKASNRRIIGFDLALEAFHYMCGHDSTNPQAQVVAENSLQMIQKLSLTPQWKTLTSTSLIDFLLDWNTNAWIELYKMIMDERDACIDRTPNQAHVCEAQQILTEFLNTEFTKRKMAFGKKTTPQSCDIVLDKPTDKP